MIFPATTHRVAHHTDDEVNREIMRKTEENITRYAQAGPGAITQRLKELDEEWDIERTLEANAAGLSLVGLALGIGVDRKWLLLPLAVGTFLFQHATQGWCPPVPILRRLGIRTAEEIAYERYALKALRGDFRGLPQTDQPNRTTIHQAMLAVQRS